MRVIAIDSDARRTSEPAMRPVAMERAREKWEKLKERVASGDLKQPEKIAAAERILPRSPGDRYSAWELRPGAFAFFESKTHLGREKRIEGKYVIATREPNLGVNDAVAMSKELSEVESGFRQLKDVLAMRPISHQTGVLQSAWLRRQNRQSWPVLPSYALTQLDCGASDHARERRVPHAGPGRLGSRR
jgi:hypothetical protein